jgi:CRISPR-associated protein Cas2
MARNAFLISYDVADDKRRDRIYNTLLDFGDHVQYSVFLCELNRMELIALQTMLQTTINNAEDQILILHLGPPPSLETALKTLGKPYIAQTRVQII